jgi:hypothetical protein
MKNSHFIRTLVFTAITLLSFIYFSCDDSGVGPPKKLPYAITGKISGWIQGDRRIVAEAYSSTGGPYALTSCTVDTGCNFVMVPPLLDESTLFPTDSIFDPLCNGGNINIMPPNIRGSIISSFKVYEGSQEVGYIDRNNYNAGDSIKTGDFDVIYFYVDKESSAGGYKLCMGDSIIFWCNDNLGWNAVSRINQRIEPGSKTIMFKTAVEPTAAWKYHSLTGEPVK